MSPFRVSTPVKILIAVDDHSDETARVARNLFPEAEHIIVSATAMAQFMVVEPLTGATVTGGYSIDAVLAADDRADEAVRSAQLIIGADASTQVEVGPAGEVICSEAAKQKADVIVVGRRSHTWLSRLFDPSVSEYVIKHAPCPVLVVSEPKRVD